MIKVSARSASGTGRERASAIAELRHLAGLSTHRGIALLLAGLAEWMAPE